MVFHVELRVLCAVHHRARAYTIRVFHVEQIVQPVCKVRDRIVPGLDLSPREIYRPPQKPRWGSSLEAAEFQPCLYERSR